MLIGVPKEIKDHEYRVGLTPDSANEVVLHGHDVIVERGAGAGIGADDADYVAVGAKVAAGAEEIFERADSSHRSLVFVPRISPKSSRPHASCSAIRCRVSRSWLSFSARAQPARMLAPVVDPAVHDLGRQAACKGGVVGMFPRPAR